MTRDATADSVPETDSDNDATMTKRKHGNADTEPLNGMQETIRAFFAWMSENRERFEGNIMDAEYLFWADREGLAETEADETTQAIFNEWLMYDYSRTGYDGTPYEDRENFLSVFLAEAGNRLSPEARVFAENAADSYPSVYRIVSVDPGKGEVLEDLFTGCRIEAADRNLSMLAEPGMSIYGRFSKNEHEERISAGSALLFLPPPQDEFILYLINGARKMTADAEGREPDLVPFLKWNSYVYYREILSWARDGFPFEGEVPDEEETEVLEAALSMREELEALRAAFGSRRRRRKRR